MKRSEMLKLMSEAYGRKNYIYFDEDDADRVLTAMEAAGVMPPKNGTIVNNNATGNLDESAETAYYPRYEWDKE